MHFGNIKMLRLWMFSAAENCDFTALRIASVTTPGLQYPLVVGANSEQRFMGRLFTSLSGGDGGKW